MTCDLVAVTPGNAILIHGLPVAAPVTVVIAAASVTDLHGRDIVYSGDFLRAGGRGVVDATVGRGEQRRAADLHAEVLGGLGYVPAPTQSRFTHLVAGHERGGSARRGHTRGASTRTAQTAHAP